MGAATLSGVAGIHQLYVDKDRYELSQTRLLFYSGHLWDAFAAVRAIGIIWLHESATVRAFFQQLLTSLHDMPEVKLLAVQPDGEAKSEQ